MTRPHDENISGKGYKNALSNDNNQPVCVDTDTKCLNFNTETRCQTRQHL